MLSHPWRLSRLLSDSWNVWQSLECGMTTALRKCPGQITGEKFETQLTFRKPTAKGKLCSYPLRQKKTKNKNKSKSPPQDMLLIFPKCWRNVNQNDNGKSNFTTHNGHHHKSTKNKFGREPGGKRIILSCWWEDAMASASIMHSLWMTGKKLSRGTKPRIWEKPISWENHVVVLNTALWFENIYLIYSYKHSRKSRRKA